MSEEEGEGDGEGDGEGEEEGEEVSLDAFELLAVLGRVALER